MMEKAWQLLLRQLASANAEFTYDDVCGWSADEFDALVAAGIIHEMAQATHVVCDACPEAHWERVRWSEDSRLTFIPCPVAGTVDVNLERMRRWKSDVSRMAILLADALELRQESLGPGGRVWRLGRRRFGGQFRDFFLVVTSEEALASTIRAADQSLVSGSGLLILPFQMEIDAVWKPARLAVVALSDIASWDEGRVVPDIDLIEDLFRRDASGKAPAVRSLPIPENATWEHLLIEVFDTSLRVEVGGYRKDLSFEQAGFGERDQRLETLRLLAASRGRLATDRVPGPKPGKTPIKNRVYGLRRHLQALFPIDGTPIEYKKGADVYQSKFRVRLAGDSSFPTPPGATWLDFRFVEREDGRLAVSVTGKAIFRAVQAPRGSDKLVGEVGQRAEMAPSLYSLEDLKLRNAKGQSSPEGMVLIELLRGGGRLMRRGDDMAVLKLGARLRDWAGLEAEPLRYSEGTGTWTTVFESSSEWRP